MEGVDKFDAYVFANLNWSVREWIGVDVVELRYVGELIELFLNHIESEFGAIDWNEIAEFR